LTTQIKTNQKQKTWYPKSCKSGNKYA